MPRGLRHVCIMLPPQALSWGQVSQHSKNIPGSYFGLATAIAYLYIKGTVSHINMSAKSKQNTIPFFTRLENTDGPSNVTSHKREETGVLSTCGLNFLLLWILQNLKVSCTYCYSSSHDLGKTLWKWRFLKFKFHYCHYGPFLVWARSLRIIWLAGYSLGRVFIHSFIQASLFFH